MAGFNCNWSRDWNVKRIPWKTISRFFSLEKDSCYLFAISIFSFLRKYRKMKWSSNVWIVRWISWFTFAWTVRNINRNFLLYLSYRYQTFSLPVCVANLLNHPRVDNSELLMPDVYEISILGRLDLKQTSWNILSGKDIDAEWFIQKKSMSVYFAILIYTLRVSKEEIISDLYNLIWNIITNYIMKNAE